ncbi:hypothetical protein O1L68_30665 [Streptomyces lydicus]|nr:hypothetical protein [Streptomyces lydicus]
MYRLRPRRGENQFVGAAAHGPGRGLPRGVQQQPGAPPLPVEAGRVGPALVERGEQGLAGDRMQGAADAASK